MKKSIKKDDVVVGILTGRQKDAMLPVDYHNNPNNRFAIPQRVSFTSKMFTNFMSVYGFFVLILKRYSYDIVIVTRCGGF